MEEREGDVDTKVEFKVPTEHSILSSETGLGDGGCKVSPGKD